MLRLRQTSELPFAGGTSGLGLETVRLLAAAGARVILTSRSAAAGQTVADNLAAAGLKEPPCDSASSAACSAHVHAHACRHRGMMADRQACCAHACN